MKILKYQGGTMRQALSQIKEELGDNALVVSTREIRRGLLGKGVEVSVAIEVDENDEPTRSSGAGCKRDTGAGYGLRDADVERIMGPLRSELRSIRSMVRSGVESKTSDGMRKEMSAMRVALQNLKHSAQNTETQVPRKERSLQVIVRECPIAAPSHGRILALVGPTGVGKTTTIAKLAANAVFSEHKKAAIVTLDTYRVGGEEQIRTYANLIGVPLVVVPRSACLSEELSLLSEYEKIYIDTAGRSLKDSAAIAALRRTFQGIEQLEVHLTLSLTTPRNVMDANYKQYSAIGISRLLFTKLDESIDFDELVRAPARLGIPLSFLTTGQSVPEDIEDATEKRLLRYAQFGGGEFADALVGAA